jgi:hypothetical protein
VPRCSPSYRRPEPGFFFDEHGKPIKAEDASTLFQRGMGQIRGRDRAG